MIESMLPHSIEAEEGVLGSILLDGERIHDVIALLRPSDFYRNNHQDIFEGMLNLFTRHVFIDLLTLSDELERCHKLEQVGGLADLSLLVNTVPTSGRIKTYAEIVQDYSLLRQVIRAAGEIDRLASTPGAHAKEVVNAAESLIHQIGQGTHQGQVQHISEVMSTYLDQLTKAHEKREQGSLTGVPSGFTDLDRLTGGFQKSDLIVLAGRPGTGKTSLALNLAQQQMGNAKQKGYTILVFSIEMSKWQLAQRMLATESGINQTRLRVADIRSQTEWDTLVDSVDYLSEGHLWIDDTSSISTMEMSSKARRQQAEHGLDLIIVDYMQLMQYASLHGKPENRVQEVSAISRSLKGMARELNVPVLALAQLSRAVEQRADKIPQLSDLRESGTIEQDSDLVMFIYEKPETKKENAEGYPLHLIVAKHRNGPVGYVPLWFQPALTQFTDYVEEKGA